MKKIVYIIVLSLAFTLGCQEVLEEEIVSGITAETYYTDAQGIKDALVTGYARLKDYYGQPPGAIFGNAGTDIYGVGRGGRWIPYHKYDPTLNSSLPDLETAWESFYKAINIYNTVITRAPEIIEDASELNRTLGEARFFRAFVYFQLVQIWGDVHMTTEETMGVETEANRTPVQEIYNTVIIPDLEFAIENLPAESDEFGRATQPAAKAIRARVAMVLEDWSKASELAKSVINDYGHLQLTDTYKEIWDMENEQNSEVIWSIQFTQDPLVSHRNNFINYFTPWYTKHPGLRQSPENGGTWVGFKPTSYFYQLWNKDTDRRFEEGLKSVWYSNTDGGPAIGDTALFYSIDVLTEEDKASRPYVIYDVNDLIADDSAWPQPMKVRDETRTNNSIKPSKDVVVVRVAEMYLTVAEAAFHLGNSAEAVEYLNTLRRKRAWPGKEDDMEISAAQLNIDFILDERARELFAEGQRWFTLKRLGLLVDRVREYNVYGADKFIQEHHRVYPIPLSQIDRARNEYKQNDGYN